MTYEEAIKLFKDRDLVGRKIFIDEAIDLSIEALEKQIAKKPLHMHKNFYCPNCKEDGWIVWDGAEINDMDNYCGICGQRIDWSE